ncbi:MAG TPA: hypothetical protein VGW38_09275 [Chloroflexota bacterium]|nr:hypothetical protein [Chloroflexota bacterium]
MTLTRKYHTQLAAAADYYEQRAANLNPGPDPANLRHNATSDQRQAHMLRCRAAELRHHVKTCPAKFHLVRS